MSRCPLSANSGHPQDYVRIKIERPPRGGLSEIGADIWLGRECSNLLFSAPAEQAQRAEARGEEWQCSGERRRIQQSEFIICHDGLPRCRMLVVRIETGRFGV